MTLYRRLLSAMVAGLLALLVIPAALGETSDYDINAPQDLKAEHLFAESALLVDEDSGEVLFSKNSRVRMFPASTTKIMTLLLALESGIPLDSRVTIPQEAADIPEGSSVIPVKPGDVVSFSDLLYGFMLSSGNDGANAVAVLVSGGIAPFVERMNRRAAELGCEGTHYVNAHGYYDAEHYTTAQDLALISRTAMKNGDFRKIVAAPKWTMTIQRDGVETSLDIISRNTLLQSGEKYYYPDCTGIKTGHHNKAGWCFVGSAERDGKRVICVVLNCAEEMSKWYDAARLFEYGFTRYEPVAVSTLLERLRNRFAAVDVEDAETNDPEGGRLLLELSDLQGGEQTLQVVSGSDVALNAAAERVSQGISVEWNGAIKAPVAQGDKLGALTLALEGLGPVAADLISPRSVRQHVVVTEAPSPAATQPPETTGTPTVGGNRPAGRSAAPLIIAALALVLTLSCAAVVLALRRERKRREREAARRRRRRPVRTAQRSGPAAARPSRGTRTRGQRRR